MSDYKSFFNNIKTHVEMLVDDRMRSHAYADVKHDLDFQIFRIITGYDEALDKIDQLEKDKQELIDCLKDIAEYTNPPMRDRSGGCFYKAKESLERITGKSIEELLK